MYKVKFETDLINAIKLTTNKTNIEIAGFFNDKIMECISSAPNYTHDFTTLGKGRPAQKIDHGVWLLRGYYPETGIMFKVVIIENKEDNMNYSRPFIVSPRPPAMAPQPFVSNREQYYVKVTMITPRKDKFFYLNGNDIITKVSENTLLDSRSDIEMKIENRKVMTPKGVKPCLPPQYVKQVSRSS